MKTFTDRTLQQQIADLQQRVEVLEGMAHPKVHSPGEALMAGLAAAKKRRAEA